MVAMEVTQLVLVHKGFLTHGSSWADAARQEKEEKEKGKEKQKEKEREREKEVSCL